MDGIQAQDLAGRARKISSGDDVGVSPIATTSNFGYIALLKQGIIGGWVTDMEVVVEARVVSEMSQ